MMLSWTVWLCLAAIFTCVVMEEDDEDISNVMTPLGRVRGKKVQAPSGNIVRVYRGIPYAEPPVGNLRLKEPVARSRFPSDPLDAFEFGASCMAIRGRSVKNALSEDCLTLNIWAPESHQKRSVMIWIHGGSFKYGSSAAQTVEDYPRYDGRVIADQGDVVFVTLNYRLGILGFLSTGDDRLPGNYGLWDQAMAIQWVKDNIVKFGGDPDQITVGGSSAGAVSAALHMMSHGSKDLFQKAIFHSGSADISKLYTPQVIAQGWSTDFLDEEEINCDQEGRDELLACLQALDAETLVNNGRRFSFAATVDGTFLEDNPHELLKETGQGKDVLLGYNANEGTFFMFTILRIRDPTTLTYEDVLEKLDAINLELPESTRDEIKERYAPANTEDPDYPDYVEMISTAISDRLIECPMQAAASSYSDNGANVYFYYLDYRASNQRVYQPWQGVSHMADIQWVFGAPTNASLGYTDEEIQFSRDVISYWTNFAKTGNPNSDSLLTAWPQYTSQDPSYLVLQPNLNAQPDIAATSKHCDFWDQVRSDFFG